MIENIPPGLSLPLKISRLAIVTGGRPVVHPFGKHKGREFSTGTDTLCSAVRSKPIKAHSDVPSIESSPNRVD